MPLNKNCCRYCLSNLRKHLCSFLFHHLVTLAVAHKSCSHLITGTHPHFFYFLMTSIWNPNTSSRCALMLQLLRSPCISLKNGQFPDSFFFIFVFSNQFIQLIVNRICRWPDSNHRSLVLEVTALPTEPQTLPLHLFCSYVSVNSVWHLPLSIGLIRQYSHTS